MPNWCENDLEVSGNKANIKAFKEKVRSEESHLSLASLVPMPKDQIDNWYEWSISNWGTKWDVTDVELFMNKERTLNYGFSSAWSPPVPWLEKVTVLFPNLRFKLRYSEPGAGFRGIAKAYKGTVEDISKDF